MTNTPKKANALTWKEQTLMVIVVLISLAITVAVGVAAALYDLAAIVHPEDAVAQALAWGRLIARSF
ncbi:hypothetical protein M3A49_39350 [Paraburkholderia sp. CNPSo 3076]|uniref:hypothetical protein n=1 Tax=Paraburkholderia sp. CNPSo 3076 TaxID=2940936 RepID=UPI002250EC74|nr:hypothetical protein [Paraburkholderia sp. CNPSo 3076]MCX5545418.1 hypothetical protein [Paraburkholderia sp. CNPSo 3076]